MKLEGFLFFFGAAEIQVVPRPTTPLIEIRGREINCCRSVASVAFRVRIVFIFYRCFTFSFFFSHPSLLLLLIFHHPSLVIEHTQKSGSQLKFQYCLMRIHVIVITDGDAVFFRVFAVSLLVTNEHLTFACV